MLATSNYLCTYKSKEKVQNIKIKRTFNTYKYQLCRALFFISNKILLEDNQIIKKVLKFSGFSEHGKLLQKISSRRQDDSIKVGQSKFGPEQKS